VTVDFDAELAKLLDQYDEKRSAVAARMRQVKADEVAFLDGFANLRRSVVRPVFEAVGAVLKARGHDFSIAEDEYAFEQGGNTTEARISIRILPAGPDGAAPRPEQCPSLAFATRYYNRVVEIHSGSLVSRSDGSAGPRGEYQLAQVTSALVKSELLKLVAEIART
jgi:hypothetical protein